MTVPYANAGAANAQDEIKKILRNFGCAKIGFMDDHEHHTTTLQFEHRGRVVILEASAQGWANMFLKQNPWNNRKRSTKDEYEKAALEQGIAATSSILRDWVKGQITAVECGVLKFEHVFAPYMIAHDGTRMVDFIDKQLKLSAPENNQ